MPDSDFSNREPNNQSQIQYRGPDEGPASQQSSVDHMYEQLAGVIRDMKSVMKNFKVFFSKYLQPEENHFIGQQRQSRHQQSYQQSINQNYENHHLEPNQNFQPQYQYYEQAKQGNQHTESHQPIQKYQYEKDDYDHLKTKKKPASFKFKKDKPPGDPNKPKAPLTPYFMFFQQNRDILRQRYPDMSLSEIGSLGGKIWGSLTEEEKDTYKSRYQEELKLFRIKMRNYKASDSFLGGRSPLSTQYSGQVLEIDEDDGF